MNNQVLYDDVHKMFKYYTKLNSSTDSSNRRTYQLKLNEYSNKLEKRGLSSRKAMNVLQRGGGAEEVLKALGDGIKEMSAVLSANEGETKQLVEKIQDVVRKQTELQTQHETDEARVSDANNQIIELTHELTECNREKNLCHSQLVVLQRELAGVNEALMNARAAAGSAGESAQTTLEAAQARVTSLEQEVANKQQTIDKMQVEINRLQAIVASAATHGERGREQVVGEAQDALDALTGKMIDAINSSSDSMIELMTNLIALVNQMYDALDPSGKSQKPLVYKLNLVKTRAEDALKKAKETKKQADEAAREKVAEDKRLADEAEAARKKAADDKRLADEAEAARKKAAEDKRLADEAEAARRKVAEEASSLAKIFTNMTSELDRLKNKGKDISSEEKVSYNSLLDKTRQMFTQLQTMPKTDETRRAIESFDEYNHDPMTGGSRKLRIIKLRK